MNLDIDNSYLNLYNREITDNFCPILIDFIQENHPHVQFINLSKNKITNSGVTFFITLLKQRKNNNLIQIDLSENIDISRKNIRILNELLEKNKKVSQFFYFYLYYNLFLFLFIESSLSYY